MTPQEPGTDATSRLSCAECRAPLAADQSYCICCGARRGPLPARIAVALSDIENEGQALAPDEALAADSEPKVEPDGIVSIARGGVVALLAMLAFGVLIGGAFSPNGLGAVGSTIVLAVRPAVQQAVQIVPSAANSVIAAAPTSGGGGSGSGGGGASNAAAAGATPPAQPTAPPAPVTVTVSNPTSSTSSSSTTPAPTLPPIDHVWLIVLGQQGYAQAWATADKANAYLASLKQQGELIPNYDAVASSELANEVALLSGQGPTPQTVANCPTYTNIAPGKIGKLQQALGDGCIYPAATQSLPQQFANRGLTAKTYVQGIGRGSPCPSSSTSTTAGSCGPASTSTTSTTSTTPTTPTTSTTPTAPTPTTPTTPTTSTTSTTSSTDPVDTIGASTCPHPALNTPSLNQSVTDQSAYVNWKNPAIYFQSLLLSGCDADDVGLGQLAKDLKNPGAVPAFSYIAADPCDDGSDTPCRPGAKAGLGQADKFLKTVVPEIERSATYKQNGLILITFASAPQSGPHWDTSSCCNQPTYPNLTSTTASGSSSTTSTTPTATTPTATTPTGTTPAPAPTTPTPTTPTPAPTTPVVTTTQTVTTTTTLPTTTTGTTTTPAACSTSSSSSTTTGATTAPGTPVPTTATTSPSTTTATTTTPGECGPVIVGTPPGGGQVGLLLISPWVATKKTDPFDTLNHFSLLKGIEQLFKLPKLGYARDSALQGFTPSMFEPSHR